MTDEMEDLNDTYPGAGNFTFGDNPRLCAELLALVRSGRKTATCAALADFDDDPGAMPKVGRADIAMNWDGSPALVIRTVKLTEIRFCDVPEDLALKEGEDASFESWRKNHERYFKRNGGFDPEMMLLFEEFELVEDLATR
ncbi:ASCH domain-containing protein [Maritimibacter sp. DP1N21-5]|uniref:ASCH domain-containing protein n=1 Tax=Maritimibacter sp. DP1N21-5 TaxID=2836867 RepID=UPI001C49142E|nr:ASCH domain-containing protein [Maritimibacter sp. DP1N21-5]MBV7408362.1 ASCH domain-containing protein [Maritimibacter sp. DP1N21-5]